MKNTLKKIVIMTAGVFLMLTTGFAAGGYVYSEYDIDPVTEEVLKEHGIDSADKLMVVAHPDDEILWGGGHLMEKGYFVVVVTNGRNDERSSEFKKVLAASGNNGIILDYPDKTFGKRDDWTQVYDKIKEDIQFIMDSKHWKLVVTHNQKGEYGHVHHVMTHDIVTAAHDNASDKSIGSLYYFGKYYKKDKIGEVSDSLDKLSVEQLKYKEDLLKLYESQSGTIKKLEHMNSFENWTK